ncbi:BON domain-containing protein [Syntrophorhabdus aromaticivorans]|uniref:BON domain-containing protein n=1 Tax=Syntrophorhabdus aromaticivorans TaxID=328301 RepID=UPI00040F629C|nr:BON domain-containing protein [Syntrophorhabdus aromaticivorans]
MICDKCGTNVTDTAKFCPKCGNRVVMSQHAKASQTVICPQCGTENPLTAKFCRKDGYSLEQARTVTPADGNTVSEALICPTCGTANTSTAKFCKKDGTPLGTADFHDTKSTMGVPQAPFSEEKKLSTQPTSTGPETQNKKTKKWLWLILIIVILLSGGAGGYLYYSGYIGKTPAKIEKKLNEELSLKGLGVTAVIDRNWITTVQGTVRSKEDKTTALNIVRSYKELKHIEDEIQVQRSPVQLEALVNDALSKNGFSEVHIRIDQAFNGTLSGFVGTQEEKEKALNIAKEHKEINSIKDDVQIKVQPMSELQTSKPVPAPKDVTRYPGPRAQTSPTNSAKIEKEINRALRNAGLDGVTAEVRGDMSATLKGSVATPLEKQRAHQIARGFRQVTDVKDLIFIVSQ